MHVPEQVVETAHAAKEGAKEGAKSGFRKLTSELIENAMLLVGGALGYRFFENRESRKRAQELRDQANAATDPKVREELEKQARELAENIGGIGLVDEIMSFNTFVDVSAHFRENNNTAKLLESLRLLTGMSEHNKDRFRRALAKIKTHEDRVKYVTNFTQASPEEQKAILDIANIELRPEEQSGLVLRTEFSAMSEKLSTSVSDDLARRKAKVRANREHRQQRIEEARSRRSRR